MPAVAVRFLAERVLDRVDREDVRHVRPVGLVRPGRLLLAAVAPVQEHPAGPPVAGVVPAEGAFLRVPAFALAADAGAADIADGVLAGAAGPGALGYARRVAGPLGRVVPAGAGGRDVGAGGGGEQGDDEAGAHGRTPSGRCRKDRQNRR